MKEDKTEKWYRNQNWVNCILGISVLVFMWFVFLPSREKFSEVESLCIFGAVITVLLFLLGSAFIGLYYLREENNYLKSHVKRDKMIVGGFREIVEGVVFSEDVL